MTQLTSKYIIFKDAKVETMNTVGWLRVHYQGKSGKHKSDLADYYHEKRELAQQSSIFTGTILELRI